MSVKIHCLVTTAKVNHIKRIRNIIYLVCLDLCIMSPTACVAYQKKMSEEIF